MNNNDIGLFTQETFGNVLFNMWLQNENIDKNDYVSTRQEFDSVEKKLDRFHEMRSNCRAEEELSTS